MAANEQTETRRAFAAMRGVEAGTLLLALAFAAAASAFSSGLASLVDAWSVPEYSHGPLIPLISLFLFLREMREVPPSPIPVVDRWQGVVVIGLALVLSAVGDLVRIADIVTYAFIVWCAGLTLVCFGWRRGLLFWPAIVHLIFMLPLPQFVYWQVSIFLQSVSSQIGVWLIALFEIPVFLDGNVIDLGVYKLQVAEACSGLRYLFPMLSFSYVFAVLYQGPKWHKALLLLSAAPITVLMNSFRIGMIGVLVNSYGIEHAEGFLHAFEGWIIFVACLAILFAEVVVLQRLRGDRRRLSEALDIEFEGLGAQLARVRRVVPSAALIATVVLTAAMATAFALKPERTAVVPERDPLVLFPKQIGDWTGRSMVLNREIERVLAADDYFSAAYDNPEARGPIDLFVAYYHKQTEGSGIHSPEVCIPAGGWEVSAWRQVTVDAGPSGTVTLNRAVIQKGLDRQLVYFWFEQRGRRMTSDYAAKVYTVWDSLTRGRSDGALVRLITPIGHAEAEAAADVRLKEFMLQALPSLPRFVPG